MISSCLRIAICLLWYSIHISSFYLSNSHYFHSKNQILTKFHEINTKNSFNHQFNKIKPSYELYFNFKSIEDTHKLKRFHLKNPKTENFDLKAPINSIEYNESNKLESKGYYLLILLFFVTLLGSLDRVAMSVAIIPMAMDLDYSESTKGLIAGMFSIGYMFGLLPSGLIGSFYSPKIVLAIGVFMWSLAQILSPYFAAISLQALYVCRFIMGASEACIIPTVQSFIARWIPDNSRSKVLGIVLSGFQLGTISAYIISPMIMNSFSWQGVFLAFGSLGIIWLSFWFYFAQDNPTNIKVIDSNEIQTNENPTYMEMLQEVPWKRIITTPQISAIALAHSAQNFGLYINLAWLPTYFYQKFQLNVDESALFSIAPWIVSAILGSLSGFVSDDLVNKGYDKTFIRRCSQSISLLVPSLILFLLSITSENINPQIASIYFILSIGSGAISVSGFGSSVQDICKSPKLTPIIYGITSIPAVFMGSLGVYLTGLILDSTHDWNYVFQLVSFVYLFGALNYITNYKAEKIFE